MPVLLRRSILVAALLTAVALAGVVEVSAVPVTLSETMTDLPVISREVTEPVAPGYRSGPQPLGASTPTVTERSAPVAAPLTFNALGVGAPEGATALRVRTSDDGRSWGPWEQLGLLDSDDGPDPGSDEDRAARAHTGTQGTAVASAPLWVGEATHLQLEVDGAEVADLAVTVIDAMGSSGGPVQRSVTVGPRAADAVHGVPIIRREQWGADESLRRAEPRYASRVTLGVVHHTAHTSGASANTYSADEAAGIMRAMYRYHTQALGWSDLGYNLVVDRFGRIYEGRAGGVTRSVIGAHARGYNTGSFGVSVIGNFVDTPPPEPAIDALVEVLGLKTAIHGIDPTGVTTAWDDVARPSIVGHRDVGSTSCPGRIQARLPEIRERVRPLSVRFPDVPDDSPHRQAILDLAAAGVTSGCQPNAFCPDASLTRAQAASFVVQALELDPIPGSRFPDVPADATHASAINVLAEQGWLVGYPDGTFRPWQPLTRGQLATVLARALGEELTRPAVSPYPDVAPDSVHAAGIAALHRRGIRGDCGGGRFCSADEARRDSTASFVQMVRLTNRGPTVSRPPSPDPATTSAPTLPADGVPGQP